MKKLLLTVNILFTGILLNAQGPSFQWAKNLPGQNGTKSVAVDASGNVYSIGISYGGDFDPSSSTYTLPTIYGGTYVSKLDASGNFLWAKQFGGDDFNSPVTPKSITVDASGNIYITGYFHGAPDFDPSSATFSITTTVFEDVFIVKLDASGNFVFAKSIGGANIDQAEGIKVDASGNIYTTGKYRNVADFDPGIGTYTLNTIASSFDVFVSKLDASGNFVWAKNFSGGGDETTAALTLDATGNVYVAGGFLNKVDFDPSVAVYTINPTNSGQVDMFLVKLDGSGNFVWAKNMGGTMDVSATVMAIDATNNLFVGGYFAGIADFDPNTGTSNLISNGNSDIFISKYDGSGNYIWAKQIGSTQIDLLFSLALDASNNVYSTGSFMLSVDFDPSASTNTLTAMHTAQSDAFILKLDGVGNFGWARQLGSTNLVGTQGNSIVVDANSNLITGGGFQGPVDFDTEATTYTMTASAGYNFVQKMSTGTVGIEDNLNLSLFSIYPNPTHGILNIDLSASAEMAENTTIRITNALGQIIYSQKIEAAKTAINTSNLNDGVYFVTVVEGKCSTTKKIIIQ